MENRLNRREFLSAAGGLAALDIPAVAQQDQTFQVGFAPLAGMQSTEKMFWEACDECTKLGFHYIETDNTRLQIVEAYANRPAAFKDQMDKRGLTMVGFAQLSAMSDPAQREQVIARNLRIGGFLQAVGGKYITHLFSPRPNPAVPREKLLESMSKEEFQDFARTANDLGKRLRGETGIRIGYHPEGGDVRARIFDRVMEATDPRYFDFWPDVGHLTAGGANPIEVFKKHRSRMIGAHFKDYDPSVKHQRNGRIIKGGFVPLGKGAVNFPPLVAFLKETKFTGHVMGELDDQPEATPLMRDYFVNKLKLKI
jgi:inosose dehydratase